MAGTPNRPTTPHVFQDGNTLRVASPTETEPRLRAAPLERRRSERVLQHSEGWLSSAGRSLSTGREVIIADLSLHGVGLISDAPCEPGERRWILVNRGHMRLSTRIQVASCRQREDGRYDVGGEFY